MHIMEVETVKYLKEIAETKITANANVGAIFLAREILDREGIKYVRGN